MSGLSKARLDRLHHVLSGYVDRQEIPGIVALVSRGDDVHAEALGTLSIDGASSMKRDAIFRIASISKPVTAVAAMILVEDCKLRLDDPIDAWIPELANRRVLRTMASEIDDTVPATRPISVRDLFTSCMGFGAVMAAPDTYPIQKYIREYRIGGDGPPKPSLAPQTDEWLRRLGQLPLMAQPGERWLYHVSIDVLGALIARVSGRSLGAFMRERIFDPLGMTDTAFSFDESTLDRVPVQYATNRQTGALDVFDGVADTTWRRGAPESGGGGLVSTVDDYFAFARMMLNKGRVGREQILSRRAVELMTSDRVTPAQRAGAELFFGGWSSWGYGMAVDIARHDIFHTTGRFGWTGGTGTTAYVDPAEGLIAILFTQRMMDSPKPPTLFTDFFTLAYGAIE